MAGKCLPLAGGKAPRKSHDGSRSARPALHPSTDLQRVVGHLQGAAFFDPPHHGQQLRCRELGNRFRSRERHRAPVGGEPGWHEPWSSWASASRAIPSPRLRNCSVPIGVSTASEPSGRHSSRSLGPEAGGTRRAVAGRVSATRRDRGQGRCSSPCRRSGT